MKKYAIISLVLVLTAALLTGCGCTPSDMDVTTRPSATNPILPTNIPETTVPTEPMTEPMTDAPTDATMDTGSATEESGATDETAETGDMSRSRMR